VSTASQNAYINDLYKLLKAGSRTTLDKYYNSQPCKCTIDRAELYNQILGQWKKTNDKEPNETVRSMFNDITNDVMDSWFKIASKGQGTGPTIITDPIGSGRAQLTTETNTKSRVVFKISVGTGGSRKGKKGGGNKSGVSDNFKIFKRNNAKIWKEVINKPKYEKLFQGYTRNIGEGETNKTEQKTGDLRQLVDIGHVEAIGSVGKAELGVGIIDGMLDMDNITETEKSKLRQVRDRILSLEFNINVTWKINEKSGILEFKEEQSYVLESADKNRGENKKTEIDAQKEVDEVMREILEIFADGQGANTIVNRKGSPSMIDMVGDMIVNTPIKRKAYKSKTAVNLTRYKPVISKVKKSRRTSKKEKVINSMGGSTSFSLDKDMAVVTPKPKKADKEKGDTVSPEEFATSMAATVKIKAAINKRLPAQIRRNMGRPALNNITGRFSNSALIESITPAAKTLLVKYTYRLDPYETFENTGKRKWPSGYNPKPLISKSIRGLALEMFKLTNLTTRRV